MPSILEREKTGEAEKPQGFMRGFADEPNWVIATNNPLKYIDPTGLKTFNGSLSLATGGRWILTGGLGGAMIEDTMCGERTYYSVEIFGVTAFGFPPAGPSDTLYFSFTPASGQTTGSYSGQGMLACSYSASGFGQSYSGVTSMRIPNGPVVKLSGGHEEGNIGMGVSALQYTMMWWQKL